VPNSHLEVSHENW